MTTPVPVEVGVAGGELPMSTGSSLHGRRKPNGSACQRRTMAGVQDDAKHAMSAMSQLPLSSFRLLYLALVLRFTAGREIVAVSVGEPGRKAWLGDQGFGIREAMVAVDEEVRATKDEGWGRGRRPVINVSWEDANAYVEWLAFVTEHPYRLLSEAEWEYACRAGTTTHYWWGDEIAPENANYGSNVGRTSEVGDYPANPFGLHDMHGNLWQWVEDRWHDTFDGAPGDGSAWIAASNSLRVMRGGSWSRDPGGLRSASRAKSHTDARKSNFGFRVARTV